MSGSAAAIRVGRGPDVLGRLWWAVKALRSELFDFRFHYPIEAVPEAGLEHSLHYHIYSDRLFFDVMDLDDNGVPMQLSRVAGKVYNPAYVAWYGLMRLEQALRVGDADGRAAFLGQIDWLVTHAVRRQDGTLVWPYEWDWREERCHFKAPWISSIAQGLAISALVRGYRVTGTEQLLDLSRAAMLVYEKPIEEGGLRTLVAGKSLYEEYPGYPLVRVLDGFLFSLLGLFDFALETEDAQASRLFAAGVEGLKHLLPTWDYRGKWSRYGTHGCLCPPHYHVLNFVLLDVVARLTGDSELARCAWNWDVKRISLRDRMEIYPAFIITKNWSRILFHWRRRG